MIMWLLVRGIATACAVTGTGIAACRDAQRAQLQSCTDKVAGLLAALQQSFTAASSKALGHQQQADSSDDEDGASQDTGEHGAGRCSGHHATRSLVIPAIACSCDTSNRLLSKAPQASPPLALSCEADHQLTDCRITMRGSVHVTIYVQPAQRAARTPPHH
jgi:hypothetical protein